MADPASHQQLMGELRTVPIPIAHYLACSYAGHIRWIITATHDNDPIIATIPEVLVAQLRDPQPAIVNEVRQHLFTLLSQERERRAGPGGAAVESAVWAFCQTMVCCFHVQLVARGAMARQRKSQLPTVMDIAQTCHEAVSLHAAGADWNAPDPSRKAAARLRRRTARSHEIAWQLEQLHTMRGVST